MRLYDEMKPIILEDNVSARVSATRSGKGWFASVRPCPECGYRRLMTNGLGDFRCNRCFYSDTKSIEKSEGLDYAHYHRRKIAYGKNSAHLFGTE